MRNALRFVSLVVVFAASAAAWPAGQVAGGQGVVPAPVGQGPLPAPVGTGFIAGQVVDVPGGKPVSEVTVQVLGRYLVNGRSSVVINPAVVTDSQGRFFFGNLRAGSYSLQVGKTGYVGPRAGFAAVIELADGERVTDAVARLMKVASLSGTLRDEAGDPVVGADVLVLRRTITSGRQVWQPLIASRSDDRGQYRAGNLAPGDYVVCVCSRATIPLDATLLTTLGSEPLQLMTVAARALSVGSDVVSLDNTLRTYPPTLHPNATTLARATKVTIAPGEDKTSVDVTVPLVRSARVSGTVVGAASPVQAGSMRLVPAGEGDLSADVFSLPPMLVQADGRFDFAMVPPGQYRLMMVHRDTAARSGGPSGMAMAFVGSRGATPPPVGATMSAAGSATTQEVYLWANQPVTVGDTGVTGLVISLNRSFSVTGRIEWIGAAPPPPEQMLQRASVLMTSANFLDPLTTQIRTAVGRVSPDATFVVTGAVPGKWVISPTVLPGYPTLKSVTIGGLDITDMALEVAEKDIADVVITYVDKPMASLTVVSGPAPPGPPAADDPSILVFPADRKFWAEPSAAGRRFRNWALTSQGTTTSDLPPGEYLVVRASSVESVDWMEATKLDALSKRAQRVTVPDTGSARVEVRR